ncbi:MAG TPA: EAL domain-containing protein [Hyphomicrobiaceae bacterium]|nr:EAL domain-containing protein [Hyphomicrobiaceae bacterium]
MSKSDSKWFRQYSGRYSAVYFGAAMIALSWIAVLLLTTTERKAAISSVSQDTANLSRAFEENVVRTVHDIDRTLLLLRRAHQANPEGLDWPAQLKGALVANDTTVQLAVIGADGLLIATDLEIKTGQAIRLDDRLHFRVHADADDDFLYISKPVLGRASGKWTVQFTRRLIDGSGRFAGVVVASFDPGHFARFYESVQVGQGGSVLLVGLDGVIRAGGGTAKLGTQLPHDDLLAELRRRDSGTVMIPSREAAPARIASFRKVRGYPLAVVVAADEAQPDSSWQRNRGLYVGSGVALTLASLLMMAIGLRRTRRLIETQCQLGEKSRQLEVTLDNITQGILMVEPTGKIGVMNSRCSELLGLPKAFSARRGATYADLIDHLEAEGEFATEPDSKLLDHIRSHEAAALIPAYERTRPDGTVLEIRNKALPDGGFVRTLTDITERRSAEAKIVHLARHDPLTGVANRAVLRQRLDEAAADLANGYHFAVLMIDLDHFKSINDTYGHLIGDKLLSEVAERLRALVRTGDLVARLGGDEFAIIAHDISMPGQAAALAERVGRAGKQPFQIDGQTLLIGTSIGIALAPQDGSRVQDLLHAADLALYAAKSSGRATYRLFSPEMEDAQRARLSLETDLRTAVAKEQFELHYQPIKAIASDEVTAYEALIRWRHPMRGMVPPLDFIALAEETGLIIPIGAWVLRKACQDMSRSGLPGRVAVNLSPLQFRDKDLLETVMDALHGSGLPAHRLEIEITESTLLHNDELTSQQLTALRDLGVHITMDDFGTGYSSLGYLLSYPIDSIKIDRSFVRGLGENANSTAIIRAITMLASSLGMSTTAEGVETEGQLALLRELGCSEAQGFLFSRPKPAPEILPAATAPVLTSSAA